MIHCDGRFLYQKISNHTKAKGIKSFLQILVSTCALLGWWGFLYPELTLTPDTVKVVEIAETTSEYNTWDFDCSLYQNLLYADRSQIVFRSKLLTNFNLFWEALQNGDK